MRYFAALRMAVYALLLLAVATVVLLLNAGTRIAFYPFICASFFIGMVRSVFVHDNERPSTLVTELTEYISFQDDEKRPATQVMCFPLESQSFVSQEKQNNVLH